MRKKIIEFVKKKTNDEKKENDDVYFFCQTFLSNLNDSNSNVDMFKQSKMRFLMYDDNSMNDQIKSKNRKREQIENEAIEINFILHL